MNSKQISTEVIKETKAMVEKFGPRIAGTKAALAAADELYEDAKNYSDEAHQEDFFVHKGAFLGWINVLVIAYIAGLVLFIFDLAWVNIILMVLSVIILYLQFIRYLPIIDFLFPRRRARNVYGVIEPKGEVKQQVIISGHHDSAYIFNFLVHQPQLYNLRVTGSIIFVILSLVLGIVNTVVKIELLKWISVGIIALGLVLIGQMWFFRSRKGTPGAGDNMASTQIAFQLGKYFYNLKGSEKELQNTRLIFASFDAEEEGLRGARAFVKKHRDKLLKTKTYVLNIECLYDEDALFFLTSDINNTVKLSDDLAATLIAIGEEHEIKLTKKPIAVLTGGTDSGEFGKIGVEATTIMGMPWTNDVRSQDYHTPNDTVDKVSKKAVEHTLDIYHDFIVYLDSE
ncbi:MAG: M28 family metallopeptidase [Bacilli bacterium]|jgi:aminopeptidase YwaD